MKKLIKEELIIRLKEVYGDEYDYSHIVYNGFNSKIKLICKKHKEFYLTPKVLLCLKNGCPKCNSNILSVSELIDKFNEIHKNKYEYFFTDYKNVHNYIDVKCPIHKIFKTKIVNHLKSGCKKCSKKYMDKEYFIELCNKVLKWI